MLNTYQNGAVNKTQSLNMSSHFDFWIVTVLASAILSLSSRVVLGKFLSLPILVFLIWKSRIRRPS